MIFVLILSACGPDVPADSEQLPDLQVQKSPTMMVDATAATQSTELAPQTAPAKPSFDIRLTAVKSLAKVVRSGETELEVQQDQMVDVQVNEGIEVVKPDGQKEQSYSILDFADDLEVELFSDTSVFLANLREQAGGSTHVNLHLNDGHIFVHLNDQTTSAITVQTLSASIKTLTNGAEFDVCQNEVLTCILVKKGVAEVTLQNGRDFLIKAGEAVNIIKDQRPAPPICAPLANFTSWEEDYRQFADTPSLETALSQLPQEPCPLNATGLPVNARILYQDEFINPFSGWERGKIANFAVRYAGLQYYRVQAQVGANQFTTSAPNELEYGDVNIDLKAIGEAASGRDFRYGLVFRQTGDQYYAFIISPVAKTWYFLKNSSTGLETLVQGTDERMRGIEAKETLRVEAYGSIFLLFINGRFMDWISDPDYVSGEVGLFVEAIDSPDAIIRFDSLIVWDMPSVVVDPNPGREYCFNTFDDDGDRLIDRSDPDCQRLGHTATPLPLSTNQSVPATLTPQQPTNTLIPQPSNTPIPQPSITPIPLTPTRRPTRSPTSPPPTNPPPTATDVPPTNPPPTDPPPTDPPPTDPPPTDPPPTDPPTDEPTEPPTEPPTP